MASRPRPRPALRWGLACAAGVASLASGPTALAQALCDPYTDPYAQTAVYVVVVDDAVAREAVRQVDVACANARNCESPEVWRERVQAVLDAGYGYRCEDRRFERVATPTTEPAPTTTEAPTTTTTAPPPPPTTVPPAPPPSTSLLDPTTVPSSAPPPPDQPVTTAPPPVEQPATTVTVVPPTPPDTQAPAPSLAPGAPTSLAERPRPLPGPPLPREEAAAAPLSSPQTNAGSPSLPALAGGSVLALVGLAAGVLAWRDLAARR